MDCTPARELPEGRHLVRVLPQALRAEVGTEAACWAVPEGWYYTDAGRARISAAVDVWQKRLEDVEKQLVAIKTPPPRSPSPPVAGSHAPCVVAGCALLVLGFVLGRMWRPPPRGPHAPQPPG